MRYLSRQLQPFIAKTAKNHKLHLIFSPKKVIDKKSFLGYKPFESIPKYLNFSGKTLFAEWETQK